MEREREKRDRGALMGTRRKIVCAQGFQGVHPRVGPAPDTTLTPPFYGVVKYLSSFLALSYHVSLASLSSSLPTLTLPPPPSFSSAPLADCVPSSASALRTLVLFPSSVSSPASFIPPTRRVEYTRVYVAPCVIAFRCVAQAQKACRASPSLGKFLTSPSSPRLSLR